MAAQQRMSMEVGPTDGQGKTANCRPLKVVLIGPAKSGSKSSLAMRWTRDTYREETETTIGAAFHTLRVTVCGVARKIELWDTAGDKRYNPLILMYTSKADAICLGYDVSDPESIEDSRAKLDQVLKDDRFSRPGTAPPILLVASKSDLDGTVPTFEYGNPLSSPECGRALDQLCKDWGVNGWMAVSCKTRVGIDELLKKVVQLGDAYHVKNCTCGPRPRDTSVSATVSGGVVGGGSGSPNLSSPRGVSVGTGGAKNLPPPVEWIPDSASDTCMACNSQFTVTKRRHHCRNCGKLFCNKCTVKKVVPARDYMDPVRVCLDCSSKL